MGIKLTRPRTPAGPRPGTEERDPTKPHRFLWDRDDGDDCALCGEGITHKVHDVNDSRRKPMVGPKEPVEPVIITLAGGSRVEIIESEGWLYLRALDGVLTVRPLNEREIYIRPVGRSGGWVPSVHPARGL